MVHGFPDLSISWQYTAQKLADAGYFVVTPDLRGFGSSSIPKEGILAFGRQNLVSDMDALRRHYCGENGSFAMIAGHDWGGTIVWATLDAFGDTNANPIAKSAIILNAPHSRIFFEFINKPKQAIKSWYMAYFQLPWIPEIFMSLTKGLYHLTSFYLEPMRSIEGFDFDQHLAVYKEALSDYDRINAMLSLYRAAKSGIWRDIGDTAEVSIVEWLVQRIHGLEVNVTQQDFCQEASDIRITIPTLVLWGENDVALTKELAYPPKDIVENNEVEFFDAGHFVHWDKPQEITERMIRFANAHNGGEQAVTE